MASMTAIAYTDPVSARQSRWFTAGAAVLAVHVLAIGFAIMGAVDTDVPEEPEGAVMLELSPMPVSAASDAPDLPTGPVVETAETITAKSLEPEPAKTELPDVEPSPLAPEPEVAIPQMRTVDQIEETKEPDPEVKKAEEQAPPQETVIPQATAPPPTAAAAAQTAASKQGTTAEAAQQEASWQKDILKTLAKHRRYPQEARSRRQQGDAVVSFTVDRAGRVVTSALVQSSGSSFLDEEALAVLNRASPLPEPPASLAGETFSLQLPIFFRIKDQ
jgi:protein TonB